MPFIRCLAPLGPVGTLQRKCLHLGLLQQRKRNPRFISYPSIPQILVQTFPQHSLATLYLRIQQTLIKSFEMGTNPVRCARFIVRKNWIIAGTDDMKLRVYNYNTMEKVKEWDAHTDYIRFIEVHPNRPYVLRYLFCFIFFFFTIILFLCTVWRALVYSVHCFYQYVAYLFVFLLFI